MKQLFFGAVLAMLIANHARAQEHASPAAPKPELTWVFSIRVEVDPAIEQGEIDGARSRFIPITGGEVYGPRLTGKVLEGGGDWQAIRPGGLTDIEARYFLEASDGTVIEIYNPGVRVADVETIEALARGEEVDPDSYYFRTQPRFRVAEGPHAWLERNTFVARGIRLPDRVIIDYYLVD